MTKREKIELAKVMFGLRQGPCKEHQVPLVFHLDDWGEGCWDCPVEGCMYHVHQGIPYPWDTLDPNYDQLPESTQKINRELSEMMRKK